MIRFQTFGLLAALPLAACSAQGEADADMANATLGGQAETPEPASEETPAESPAPDVFAATAWRVTADDGARYTTYLDPEGTYRDFRNGDPWQEGSWSHADAESESVLCFTPDVENAIERCWEPGRMRGNTMQATGDDGTTIELERVDYTLPDADTDDAA